MKDGYLLSGIKRLVLLNHKADHLLSRLLLRLRGEELYVLKGDCRGAAKCCERPSIRVIRPVWYIPIVRRLFLLWQRRVNGFVLSYKDHEQKSFIFECTHFDRQTRRCDSYRSRPWMCRDYPRALLYQPNPEFFTECGYRPVLKSAGRFQEAINRIDLPEEKKAELEKKLRLK